MLRTNLFYDNEKAQDAVIRSVYDPSKKKNGNNGDKPEVRDCPDIDKNYEWAEMKTSIFTQLVSNNAGFNHVISNFLTMTVITPICNRLKIDVNRFFLKYLKDLRATPPEKTNVNPYPVAQPHGFLTPDDLESIANLKKDAYTMFNICRYLWDFLVQRKTDTKDTTYGDLYSLLIIIFQQRNNQIIDMLRIRRYAMNSDAKQKNLPLLQTNRNIVGITSVRNNYLNRKIISNPLYTTIPWIHPGQENCRVPYVGKYGRLIREERERNGYYGSLMCSYSGSSQFASFLFLLGIIDADLTPDQCREYSKILVVLSCLYLIGDGGHNVREILFAIIASIILLRTFIGEINKELRVLFGNNDFSLSENSRIFKEYNYYPSSSPKCLPYINNIYTHFLTSVKDREALILLKLLVKTCAKWEVFVNYFYKKTLHINIVGIFQTDLDELDESVGKIRPDRPRNFADIKQYVIDNIFNTQYDSKKPDDDQDPKFNNHYNNIQLFFALEGNRHLLNERESFFEAPNKIISEILPETQDEVNAELHRKMKECNAEELFPKVPFAFSSTKKSSKRK